MQTWLRSLPRLEIRCKSFRKSRQSRPAWRSNFDASNFAIERLEDRTLLAADIGITQPTLPPAAALIGLVTYTFVVTNNDAVNPTVGATFTDTFTGPAGTTANVSDSAGDLPAGALSNGAPISFTTQIPASGNDTVTVTLTTTATGTLTNSASVDETGDTNPLNNTTAPTNTVIASATDASVSIAKVGPPAGTFGTSLTYTITITNAAGAADAAGVVITDTLPAGASFDAASDSSGGAIFHTADTVTDTVGTLAAGATDTLTLVATPDPSTAGTTITNSASVTTTTPNIGTPTTATASTAIAAAGATLTISKSANATDTVGTNLTYTIVVSNTGGSTATATTMTDTLPPGLTFVSASDVTTGAALPPVGGTITDDIGSLAAGGSDTVQIVVTPTTSVAGTSVTNTASAASPDFNRGAPISGSATTAIADVKPPVPTGVGFLAGVPGDGTPQTFVQNLYRELLGREPDAAGDAAWVSYLMGNNNALGRYAVIQRFMNTLEYKVHYIMTVYQVFLGRTPDAGGLQYWIDKMGNPGTPGQHTGSSDEKFIVAAILGSDEFYIKSGNTPQSWINAVYEDVFGRAADGGGLDFWQHELQVRGAGDRDGIVRDLLTAPEAVHDLLDSFYPTPGGTASTPLAAPGTVAGMGMTDLALLTGAGWENLYLEGPYDSAPEGNDGFFASLVGGGNWDDIQSLMLNTDQFYTNPNRLITA